MSGMVVEFVGVQLELLEVGHLRTNKRMLTVYEDGNHYTLWMILSKSSKRFFVFQKQRCSQSNNKKKRKKIVPKTYD